MQAIQPLIDKFQGEKWPRIIAFIVMGVGTALRVKMFLMNRSLFIDEANLAINIFNRGYVELLQPLAREQFAPPLFLWITEFISRFMGATEYAVRLYPLLCGILSIPVLYRITAKLQHPWFGLYPLVVFCCNDFMVTYSATFKQYSSDVLVTLLLLLTALHYTSLNSSKRCMFWVLAGMVAVWLSMPVVFILSGIGIYYLINGWHSGSRKEIVYTSLAIAGWLASFAVYFGVMLKHQVGSDYLQNYHEGYFLPLPPLSVTELQSFIKLSLKFFVTLFNATVLTYVWCIITVLTATYFIYKRYPERLALLVLPIITCFLASSLHFYSLMPRLTLFLLPLFLLLISIGAESLFRIRFQFGQALKVIIVVMMLITTANAGAYSFFVNQKKNEEIKKVFGYLQANKTNDQHLYVHHGAEPAFTFYSEISVYRQNFSFTRVYEADEWKDDKNIKKKFSTYPKRAEVWLIFTNTWPYDESRWLDPLTASSWKVNDQEKFHGASCYLLSRKE